MIASFRDRRQNKYSEDELRHRQQHERKDHLFEDILKPPIPPSNLLIKPESERASFSKSRSKCVPQFTRQSTFTNTAPIVELYVINNNTSRGCNKIKESIKPEPVKAYSGCMGTKGYSYFRGKPPLTPFTRLGCYRAQSAKSRRTSIARSNNASSVSSISNTNPSLFSAENRLRLYKRSISVPNFHRRSGHVV